MSTIKINFDATSSLLRAVATKPTSGTTWVRHKGDKYTGLVLGVGKTRATWYMRKRVNGKPMQTRLGTFPDMSVREAVARMGTTAKHKSNEVSSRVRTLEDAWVEHCRTWGAKPRTIKDMDSKMRRCAAGLLKRDVTSITFADVRACLLSIKSISTRYHVKVAINSCYELLDIPTPIERGKLKAKHLGKIGRRSTHWKDICDADELVDRRDWSPMWNAIMTQHAINPLRGVAWIVMLFTGIRAGDVRSLKWDQVSMQRGEIKLHEMKNGETRTLPVCDVVVRALMSIRSAGSEFVFPANRSGSGYLDALDPLSAPVNGKSMLVIRQHDTRHHFTSACAAARVPSPSIAFLRGDITSTGGARDEMIMHYIEDLPMAEAVADVEKFLCERIGLVPSFE